MRTHTKQALFATTQTCLKTLHFAQSTLGRSKRFLQQRAISFLRSTDWLPITTLTVFSVREELNVYTVQSGLFLRMLRIQLHLKISPIRSTSGEAWET
jgi:hypothetical protein